MKKAIVVSVAALFTLSACATAPKDIAPTYVSPVLYQNLSCGQLGEEAARVSTVAAVASGAQNSQAGTDAAMVAAGLIIFWPAVFFIGGDKQTAAEIARLKGEMVAIEAANRDGNCGLVFQS
jgi:hypothetical protein